MLFKEPGEVFLKTTERCGLCTCAMLIEHKKEEMGCSWVAKQLADAVAKQLK